MSPASSVSTSSRRVAPARAAIASSTVPSPGWSASARRRFASPQPQRAHLGQRRRGRQARLLRDEAPRADRLAGTHPVHHVVAARDLHRPRGDDEQPVRHLPLGDQRLAAPAQDGREMAHRDAAILVPAAAEQVGVLHEVERPDTRAPRPDSGVRNGERDAAEAEMAVQLAVELGATRAAPPPSTPSTPVPRHTSPRSSLAPKAAAERAARRPRRRCVTVLR